MKKRLAFISLFMALIILVSMPASTLAAKPVPFGTTGVVTYLSPGTVFPAGESNRWVVVERELQGTFLSGDINGNFTMAYTANVKLATQAGNLHGTLKSGAFVFKLTGKILPLELVPTPIGVNLPKLTINGHWTATDGTQGEGSFEAWVIFIPTPDGHVGSIVASGINLSGSRQP